MSKQKAYQWAQWLLAGCLACWSVTGMAWSFSNSPQAPVEEAQPDGAGGEGAPVSAANDTVAEESTPSASAEHATYSTERTQWEDSPEESRGEHPRAEQHEEHASYQSPDEPSVAQLSQRVDNLTAMNLPARIDELQQAVSRLRGQVQLQQHTIQQLQARLSHHSVSHSKAPRVLSHKPKVVPPAVSHTSPQPASAPAQAAPVSGQREYSAAFDALMKKQYSQAKTAFLAYIQHHGNGQYVSNAYYWLAEIALVKRDYDVAQKRLNTVITHYPQSSKYPDARYKLAMTHLKMHQTSKAREELQALSHEYAGKTVGRLASIALEQLDLDQ